MKKVLIAAVATAALASAAAAQAHVTVHPNALPSGGFTTIGIRVPNERPKAATTKIDVQFPSGFYFLSYGALPGWKVKVLYRTLTTPVTVFGESIKQEVDRVVFTGRLPAGQYVEFPLSVAIPADKPGTVLTFKALQTYSNGEVVRWIGPPGADEPAPQVKVIGAKSAVADYPGGVAAIRTTQSVFSTSLPGLG
jgi:uncharacterized protein YcnI